MNLVPSNQQNVIMFYDKGLPFFEFSNFYEKAPFIVDGVLWSTSEHFYQAMKFTHHPEFMQVIRNCDTTGKVYALANQKKGQYTGKWNVNKNLYGDYTINQAIDTSISLGIKIRSDWDSVKDSIMMFVLRCKFTQNSQIKNILISTYNSYLIEDSPRDSYWGIGKNKDGKNMLGQLLMALREELRNT